MRPLVFLHIIALLNMLKATVRYAVRDTRSIATINLIMQKTESRHTLGCSEQNCRKNKTSDKISEMLHFSLMISSSLECTHLSHAALITLI